MFHRIHATLQITLLLILGSVGSAAYASGSPRQWIATMQTSGRHSDVEIQDSLVYAATRWGLQIASIANPNDPKEVATLPIAGAASVLDVANSKAYVGVDEFGVVIIDCKIPSQPVIASCIQGDLSSARFSILGDLLVVDSILFVAFQNASSGIYIYNIADGYNPHLIQRFNFSTSPDSLTQPYELVRDDSLLIVTDPFGVWVADISDPALPEKVGAYRSLSQSPTTYAALARGRLLAGDDLFLTSFDLSSLALPVPVITQFLVDSAGDLAQHLTALDTTVLLASNVFGVEVLTVPSDPSAALTRIGRLNTPGSALATAAADSVVAIADGDRGLAFARLSGGTLDSIGYLPNGRDLTRLTRIGRFLHGRSGGKVAVIDVHTPTAPTVVDSIDFLNVWQLSVQGETLFATDQDALNATTYLKVFDLADTIHPVLLVQYEMPTAQGRSFEVRGGYSYHADSRFTILDITELDAIHPVGQVPGAFPGNGSLVLVGNTAFASYDAYLYAIDISDPSVPVVMTPAGMSYPFAAALTEDTLLFTISWIGDQLRILNVADPMAVQELGTIATPSATWLCKQGNIVYVSSLNSKVLAIDVADPQSPRLDSTLLTPGAPGGLAIDDSMLYVGDGYGLTVFRHASGTGVRGDGEAHSPTSFSLGDSYPNPFNGSVTIPFALSRSGYVTLAFHNSLGRLIERLVLGHLPSGAHRLRWEPDARKHSSLPTGLLFYSLTVDDNTIVRKMVYLK